MEHEYQPVEDAFREGTVMEQSNETLSSFLVALSNQVIQNENVRHRDIIRGITINHILLQRHIEALDRKNSRTTWLVVLLTVATLIGTASQTWYGYKADKRAEVESAASEVKRQTQESKSAPQTHLKPQVSGQATKKYP